MKAFVVIGTVLMATPCYGWPDVVPTDDSIQLDMARRFQMERMQLDQDYNHRWDDANRAADERARANEFADQQNRMRNEMQHQLDQLKRDQEYARQDMERQNIELRARACSLSRRC